MAHTSGVGNREKWKDVRPDSPCPVCKKSSWCTTSPDGEWCACRREAVGPFGPGKLRRDSSGADAYIHRLTPRPAGERWEEPRHSLADGKGERADLDTLDRVYRALLEHLDLSERHREDLRRRGYRGDPLAAGYRTLDRRRAAAVYELVRQGLEPVLPRVPGLWVAEKNGRRYWSLKGGSGLLVPIRDTEGRIVALVVRLDEPTADAKYIYVSSKKAGGAGPGSPCHVPPFGGGKAIVRVTEGALKASLATTLDPSMRTVGLPGVSSWRQAAAVLHRLGATTARVAYDADARRNPTVARNLAQLVEDLTAKGYAVELETWEEADGKGIDDLLAAGKAPAVHRGDAVGVAVAEIVRQAQGGRDDQPEQAVAPSAHLTDQGNAQRLVKRHGRDLHHCHPWAKDLVWDDCRWRLDDTAKVEVFAKETIRHLHMEAVALPKGKAKKALVRHALASESARALSAMIRMARSEPGIAVLPADLDRDIWSLNCPNGTLDLRTGKLRPHRREDLATKLCPTRYDSQARCPLWEKVLGDVFDRKEEVIAYVQRLLGYCLTGDVTEHIFPVCHGPGGNGKGTVMETIKFALGDDYCTVTMPDFLLARQGERHPTETADLFGRRLAICQETGEGKKLNEPLMKWLTGGDTLRARRMREDFWEFAPTHKLFLLTNHKPEIQGRDQGAWRRLRLIPFAVCFEGEKKDPAMRDRLKVEAPGILAWMVRGCLAWQKDGLQAPEAVLAATKEYRSEEDVVGAFIAQECVTGPDDYRCSASALHQRFQKWVAATGETGIVASMSQRRFAAELTSRGFKRAKSNTIQYLGIALREEDPACES